MSAIEALDKFRMQLNKVAPREKCCEKQPMHESNGNVTMCCIESCPWLELDRLLVDVYIAVEVGK